MTLLSGRLRRAFVTAGLFAAALCLIPTGARGAKPAVSAAARREKILKLRSRLAKTRAQIRTKREVVHTIKVKQNKLSDLLNVTYQALEELNGALHVSQARLQRAEISVRRATSRLRDAQVRLKLQRSRFGRRIAASYTDGPVSFVDVLVGARNMSDFMDRQYYVGRVVEQDADMLASLRNAQEDVEREWQRLNRDRAELAAAHDETAFRAARASEKASEREQLLKKIKAQRVLQEQELRELEEDSLEVQRALEKELAKRLANPRGFRSLPRWSGQFFMPARGRVASGFGYRYHPILHYRRLHAGVDICPGYGAPVFAANSGEVFSAGWRGGYGKCIIVLHGGSVSTLYGHLSQIRVRAGQTVQRGQLIGNVGSTGLSTGPHLHFEVRRNGVPVNPL
jgi:murein DD-endopeptidase MepM/ murein hydrolase activator NlpD